MPSLQPVIDLIDSIDVEAFIQSLENIFDWVLSSFTSIFTSLGSIINYGNTAISGLVSFVQSNSGYGSLLTLTWNNIPSFYIWVFVLGLSFAVLFVAIRRLS